MYKLVYRQLVRSLAATPLVLILTLLLSTAQSLTAEPIGRQSFTYLLTASRPGLMSSLTEAEGRSFELHRQYLKELREQGFLVMAGACRDGAFGLVVIEAANEGEAREIMGRDPIVSSGLLLADFHPFYPPLLGLGLERIPLQILESEEGSVLPFVQLNVDGVEESFLLDTGAADSSVVENEHTRSYESLGIAESVGASGIAAQADLIEPKTIEMGNRILYRPRLKRLGGRRSILGMDILQNFILEIDLAGQELSLLRSLPQTGSPLSLRRLPRGHLILPVNLGRSEAASALFDTGADVCVVDMKYVKAHPELFRHLRSEDGVDGNGNTISSETYLCPSLTVGELELHDVEMAAFEFSETFRGSLQGVPIILGNNVSRHARWFVDVSNSLWFCQPYLGQGQP